MASITYKTLSNGKKAYLSTGKSNNHQTVALDTTAIPSSTPEVDDTSVSNATTTATTKALKSKASYSTTEASAPIIAPLITQAKNSTKVKLYHNLLSLQLEIY
jgi:hypothetical protein